MKNTVFTGLLQFPPTSPKQLVSKKTWVMTPICDVSPKDANNSQNLGSSVSLFLVTYPQLLAIIQLLHHGIALKHFDEKY